MRKLLRDIVRESLRPLETLVLLGRADLPFPPIFIVSPPRSGSTLLYLLATQKFHLSYFSNFSMSCPASPALLTTFGARFGVCAGGTNLENRFGETFGWNAPNQGYRAWNRWFPADLDYVDPQDVTSECRRQVRRTIGAIEGATASPFINKWQKNTTRVQALQAIFPEAVFLHLQRDPILTVQSIMSASQKLQTDDNEWFSAMPRSYRNTSGKTTLQKAAEQVALLEMDLNVDKKLVGKERFFELSFRDLCRDTNAVLNDFSTWYAARTGIRLRTRRDLRTDLKENSSIRIGEQEIAEIKRVFDRLGFHLE
jgi:hypothetical protein